MLILAVGKTAWVGSELLAGTLAPKEDPLDPENIVFLRNQLRIPSSPSIGAFTPRRLIDISDTKRLVTSLNVPDSGPKVYASLSYCWGSPGIARQQPKLLSTNIDRLSDSIADSDISPVLSDAIRVCRALGIPYLWADSLCIIQDDRADWEEQSQQMAKIFEGAFLTICALASCSCMEGFLKKRPALRQFPYISPFGSELPGTFSLRPVHVVGGGPRLALSPSGQLYLPFYQDRNASEWDSRGWVWQERVMSPRKLFFGHSMLHLQQKSTLVSEDGHELHYFPEDDWYPDTVSLPEMLSLSSSGNTSKKASKQAAYDMWHAIVHSISFLDWTDPRDLFPGLSGAAALLGEICDDDGYWAGHWAGDLKCNLIWNARPGNRMASGNIVGYRCPTSLKELLVQIRAGNHADAPSWSWASRPNFEDFMFRICKYSPGVCRYRSHLRLELSVLASRILVEGVNPFGRLQGPESSLVLLGRVINWPASNKLFLGGYYDEWFYFPAESEQTICMQLDWQPSQGPPDTSDTPNIPGTPDIPGTPETSGTPETPGPWTLKTSKALETPESDESFEASMEPTDYERQHLRLLLVSSCCSEKLSSLDSECGDDHESVFSEWIYKVPGPVADTYRLGYRHTYSLQPEYDPQENETCPECRDSKRRRDIWGLLICPVESGDMKTRGYYRVGTFRSRAEHGGSDMFRGVEPQEIELV